MTPEKICITGEGGSGKIDFTAIDSIKHVVKGTFSFKGKDDRTGKMMDTLTFISKQDGILLRQCNNKVEMNACSLLLHQNFLCPFVLVSE